MLQLQSLQMQLENLIILLEDANQKGNPEIINKIFLQIKEVEKRIIERKLFLEKNKGS